MPRDPECFLHERELMSINTKLDRLLVAVEGDNNHNGLKLKVDRLNQSVSFFMKGFWLLLAAVAALIVEKMFT